MADSKKLEEAQKGLLDDILIEKKPEPQTIFKAPSLRVETVVVYLDRAEVCRSFRTKVTAGQNELLVTDLSQSIDKDSIRVEGRGSATIAEVSVQTKHLGSDSDSSSCKKEELQKELDRLRLRESIYKQKQHRLEKQRSVLDGFADNVTKGSIKPDGKDTSLNDESLQSMVNFFDIYDKQASKLDDSLHVLKQEMSKTQTQIDAVTKNMREMNIQTIQETKELTIIVESAKEEEVELYVSYIVFDAKWSPRYDMRVFSNDGQLKILYYGMIQQSSGEDWDDAKLCLSTATPSIGGNVPQLETQKLSFRPRIIPQVKRAKRFGSFRGKSLPNSVRHEFHCGISPAPDYIAASLDMSLPDLAESQCSTAMEVPEAEVRESIATTLFEIARRSSIPSDNVAHKVSVAIIDLKPTFEYECIPRKANHAYLKAKVKNTSPYALLAGPTSIFLDNNFVSKSELRAVSPQEEFTCSLGVDPAVKIDYKPVQKLREQSGLLSKTMCTVHKQVTEMKNSRLDSIHILMKDQLPLSTEEKLKVVLLEPSLKQTNDASKPVRLNKQNNVEWDLELQPQETREVILKYSVEHPVSETIEVSYATSESSLI